MPEIEPPKDDQLGDGADFGVTGDWWGSDLGEDELVSRLTRPIIGIENRTAQEVFDIMADRIRHSRPQSG